jgi:hypothetical protein
MPLLEDQVMAKSKVDHDTPERLDPLEEYRRGYEDCRDAAVLNLEEMAVAMVDYDDLAAATLKFIARYLMRYQPPE